MTTICTDETNQCTQLLVLWRGRKQRQLGLVPVSASRRFRACYQVKHLASEQQFLQKMEQIKELDPAAHKCPELEDTITPSVRKKLEYLKEKQRDKKRGNTNVLAGLSNKRGTIRIGSPIKRGEYNRFTEGGSMEYQHKMDMEALAEVQREICNRRDDELNRPEDSLEAAYSFDIISEFQDNELNMHQVVLWDIPDLKGLMQVKKFKFDANRTGSTADKAFNVSKD
ncbi:hypothetical protein Tco_0972210 [Tanacetum coccineum]